MHDNANSTGKPPQEGSALLYTHWPFSLTALEHGAFALCGLLVYVLVTRIGQHRRQPSAAVAWVLVIAVFPFVGLPLFLLFGTRKFARPGLPMPVPRADTAAPVAIATWPTYPRRPSGQPGCWRRSSCRHR